MTLQSTTKAPHVNENGTQLAPIREVQLIGNMWKQPLMVYRDRIIVTQVLLSAGSKADEMKVWMQWAVEN